MAVKKFPYAVIWNGEIVPANTPIEVEENEALTKEDKPKRKAVK